VLMGSWPHASDVLGILQSLLGADMQCQNHYHHCNRRVTDLLMQGHSDDGSPSLWPRGCGCLKTSRHVPKPPKLIFWAIWFTPLLPTPICNFPALKYPIAFGLPATVPH
jgi:hypothetical protein